MPNDRTFRRLRARRGIFVRSRWRRRGASVWSRQERSPLCRQIGIPCRACSVTISARQRWSLSVGDAVWRFCRSGMWSLRRGSCGLWMGRRGDDRAGAGGEGVSGAGDDGLPQGLRLAEPVRDRGLHAGRGRGAGQRRGSHCARGGDPRTAPASRRAQASASARMRGSRRR